MHWNVQCTSSEKILLNNRNNKTQLLMAFCHFYQGDITAQLEYEKHTVAKFIALQKEEYFVTDDKLKAKPMV
jgi:hypothetical protein